MRKISAAGWTPLNACGRRSSFSTLHVFLLITSVLGSSVSNHSSHPFHPITHISKPAHSMDPSHREHYSVGPLSHLATSSSSLTFPAPPLPIPLYTLSVCFFLELGPTHWCLLIREPGAHRGFVHHVTGTPLEMEYWAIPDARPEDALKEATVYEVATFPGERLDDVRRVLEGLPVLKAAMRERYKRNCQVSRTFFSLECCDRGKL